MPNEMIIHSQSYILLQSIEVVGVAGKIWSFNSKFIDI